MFISSSSRLSPVLNAVPVHCSPTRLFIFLIEEKHDLHSEAKQYAVTSFILHMELNPIINLWIIKQI